MEDQADGSEAEASGPEDSADEDGLPARGDGTSDAADELASIDASVDARSSLLPDGTADGRDAEPTPLALWQIIPADVDGGLPAVSAVAIAGNSLYVAELNLQSNVGVYRTSLAGPPPYSRPTMVLQGPPWALTAASHTVYVATNFQIIALDDWNDAGSTVVVDMMSAFPFPSTMLGQVTGLATDGTSVFWTQVIGSGPGPPNTILMRHDLGTSPTSFAQQLVASAGETLAGVAVDTANAYTVRSMWAAPIGELDMLPKNFTPIDGAPTGAGFVAGGVTNTAPLTVTPSAQGPFALYFVDMGQVALTKSSSQSVQFSAAHVDTYAIDFDRGWLFVGSGPNLLYTPLGQNSPRTLVATGTSSTIGGIAVGSGFVAYFSRDVVGVVAEP
jgi:hypothetical protein